MSGSSGPSSPQPRVQNDPLNYPVAGESPSGSCHRGGTFVYFLTRIEHILSNAVHGSFNACGVNSKASAIAEMRQKRNDRPNYSVSGAGTQGTLVIREGPMQDNERVGQILVGFGSQN